MAQDLLSPSLFTPLILWSAGLWTCRVLLTLKISIALAIHSLDPLDRGKRLRLERVTCRMSYPDRDNGMLSIMMRDTAN